MNTMHENLRHPRVQPASDSSVELSNSVATVFLQIQRTSMTNMETQPMIKLISLTKPQDTPTKKKKKKKKKQTSQSFHSLGEGEGKGKGCSTRPVSGADLSRAPAMAPKANRTWFEIVEVCEYVNHIVLDDNAISSEHAHQQKAYHDCSNAFAHQRASARAPQLTRKPKWCEG